MAPATELQDALRGLRAAVRVETLPGRMTREQHRQARAGVERAALAAADAGASLEELAAAMGCTPGWASARLARARRAGKERLPDNVLTIEQVAERMHVTEQRVTEYRKTGRLPMRQLNGWWVVEEKHVALLEATLHGKARGAVMVGLAAPPERPQPPSVWRDVPMCARPAPPPWPVSARCRLDANHWGDHQFARA